MEVELVGDGGGCTIMMLAEAVRKLDKPGMAYCVVCKKEIN